MKLLKKKMLEVVEDEDKIDAIIKIITDRLNAAINISKGFTGEGTCHVDGYIDGLETVKGWIE